MVSRAVKIKIVIFFQDFLKFGRNSKYADLFITLDKIWKDGNPVEEDISKMFLRRKTPYSTFKIEETGVEETVWTTFGKENPSEQIDFDINSEKVKELLRDFLVNFSRNRFFKKYTIMTYDTSTAQGSHRHFFKPQLL